MKVKHLNKVVKGRSTMVKYQKISFLNLLIHFTFCVGSSAPFYHWRGANICSDSLTIVSKTNIELYTHLQSTFLSVNSYSRLWNSFVCLFVLLKSPIGDYCLTWSRPQLRQHLCRPSLSIVTDSAMHISRFQPAFPHGPYPVVIFGKRMTHQ